jgi:Zn-dependent protease
MEDVENESQRQKQIENLRAVAAHMAAKQPPMPADEAPGEGRPQPASGLKRWGPMGVLLALVLGKLKWLLVLVKFAKLKTLLTMLIAVWAYGSIWGLPFAVGFILLIFVHELGHGLVMRQQGIPAGAPVFIPFVGAVIAMKGMPRNAYVEALVGIGGPALGTVGAAVCLAIAWTTQSQFWYALASTGFLINLFNMLPVSPLDGGRIAGVISRWLWLVGFGLGGFLFFKTQSPLLFLILVFGVFSFFRMLKQKNAAYYAVDVKHRTTIALCYFSLIAIMTIGMWLAERPLRGLL